MSIYFQARKTCHIKVYSLASFFHGQEPYMGVVAQNYTFSDRLCEFLISLLYTF